MSASVCLSASISVHLRLNCISPGQSRDSVQSSETAKRLFFVRFFPVFDVLGGEAATALAFAIVFELAGIGGGFAAAESFAIVLSGAILDLRSFPDRRSLACGAGGAGLIDGTALVRGGAGAAIGAVR